MEHEVTLLEMLDARERRVYTQQRLLQKYPYTLISFTMNIAGPIKNSPLILEGFSIGKRFIKERINANHMNLLHFEEICEVTGNEAYYVLKEDALTVKEMTAEIEDSSKLGRLFDIDILRADGTKVDRAELGLSPHCCLICGKPAKECARSRTHSVVQLQQKTTEILEECINEIHVADAARLAAQALLYEVCTTPKPGLVDRTNSGSHKDMDIFTFLNSTCALQPYFKQCTLIGRETKAKGQPATETFSRLRAIGKAAEAAMFAATGGVNTHKGAIFSVGIVCAALGRLQASDWNDADVVLAECAAMTKGLVASDFANVTKENATTVGQKLYVTYKITGIRGQVEAGFPAIKEVGLPTLKKGIAQYNLSINDAGYAALLALMTAATDTNLIARSDKETQEKTVEQIKELLKENPYPDKEEIERLDASFIEKNLSPGGSADLLAICYFLYFLQTSF